MASERVEALESAIAAWVGAVPRTKAEGKSPESTRIAWVEATIGVVIGVAAGVSGMEWAAAAAAAASAPTLPNAHDDPDAHESHHHRVVPSSPGRSPRGR